MFPYQLQFASEQNDASWSSANVKDLVFLVQVSCQVKADVYTVYLAIFLFSFIIFSSLLDSLMHTHSILAILPPLFVHVVRLPFLLQGKMWTVRRTYEEFRTLDAHLHQCIYDRRYSQLIALPSLSEIRDRVEVKWSPFPSPFLLFLLYSLE